MARPPKEIRAFRGKRGRWIVAYLEQPGTEHTTSIDNDRPESEALAWARRNKARLLAAPEKPLLFRDLAKGFFDEAGEWYRDRCAKGREMTAASLALRQAHLDNYLIPLFGEVDIRELLADQINTSIRDTPRASARSLSPSGAKPLTRATRSKILYSLKLMYDHWVGKGWVRANPTDGIVKYSKDPERPRGALPREVLPVLFPGSHGAMVRLWGNSMWAALMLVLYDTGTRAGEPRALRWRDYYPDRNFLPIRSAIEGGTADKRKGTKDGSVKAAYLQDRTVQELAIWRAESRFNGDDDYIFTVTGQAPVSNAAIGQKFRKVLEELGYESTGWTPYWLRHSFVTYGLEVLGEAEIAALAGHSVQVSRATYQHADDETLYRRTAPIRKKLGIEKYSR